MRLTHAFAVAALASLASAASAQETIRMGTEGFYPPFNYFDSAGNIIGFDIDIGNALCAAMEVTCEWVTTDWDGIIPALNANNFDTIIASMGITDARSQVVSFTDPYYFNAARFVAPRELGLTSAMPADLVGMVVGAQSGTLEVEMLNTYFPGVEVRLYPRLDDALLDIQSGRIDLALAGQFVIGDWLASDQGACCAFVGEAFMADGMQGTGIAVRKADDDLRARLNAALAQIIADGTYDQIRARYFDFDIMTRPPTAGEVFN